MTQLVGWDKVVRGSRLFGGGGDLLGPPNSARGPKWAAPWALVLSLAPSVACSAGFWEEGETFFYEVETAAGTSYLLGTTHVGVSFEELPPHVREAMESVEVVGFETEPSAPLDDEVLFELGLLPRGQPILSQRLPAEVWPRLVEALASRVDEVRLRRFKPWLARFVLGLTFVEGLPRLEVEIETEAKAANKTTFVLESPREQLEVLASIPEDEVLEQLIMMATEPDEIRRQLNELFSAYERADAGVFERTFLEPADSEEVELLIRARNRRWVEPAKARFESGPALLAVGCAHLVGPEGLLVLLEESGLTLRPTPTP